MASQSLERLGLTSAVAAPKDLLLENLNSTLKSYLLVTLAVALLSLMAAFIISRAVTRQVSSALLSLTTVFGMGTGGTSALLSPTLVTRGGIEPPLPA